TRFDAHPGAPHPTAHDRSAYIRAYVGPSYCPDSHDSSPCANPGSHEPAAHGGPFPDPVCTWHRPDHSRADGCRCHGRYSIMCTFRARWERGHGVLLLCAAIGLTACVGSDRATPTPTVFSQPTADQTMD